MPQQVFTQVTEDYQTGEVIKREIFRKSVENKEQFVRTYIEDIGLLAKCSGAETSTMLCLLKYTDYNTNKLFITADRRREISDSSGLKLGTVHTAISRLVKKNLLVKCSSSTYILNPKIFFYGADPERSKVFEAIIRYEIKA